MSNGIIKVIAKKQVLW